jgi:hypothetical protein
MTNLSFRSGVSASERKVLQSFHRASEQSSILTLRPYHFDEERAEDIRHPDRGIKTRRFWPRIYRDFGFVLAIEATQKSFSRYLTANIRFIGAPSGFVRG